MRYILQYLDHFATGRTVAQKQRSAFIRMWLRPRTSMSHVPGTSVRDVCELDPSMSLVTEIGRFTVYLHVFSV